MTFAWDAAEGISRALPLCWECEQPLDEEDLQAGRSAHNACILAHIDYVERWGTSDADG